MLRRVSKEEIVVQGAFPKFCCSFLNEKHLKLSPKLTKNPKFFLFQSFYEISGKVSTDSVDWNAENVHQDSSLLSGSL